eukprot:scaffold71437_cov32-Attheya_sp.AAC.3
MDGCLVIFIVIRLGLVVMSSSRAKDYYPNQDARSSQQTWNKPRRIVRKSKLRQTGRLFLRII